MPTMRAEVPCRMEYLDGIVCLLDSLCEGVPEEIKDHVLTAVNEAFANVVQHSGLGEADRIEMHAERDRERILLQMADEGIPFAASFEAARPPPPMATGQMGLFLIRQMMDEVTYRRESRNVLRMIKYLGGRERR